MVALWLALAPAARADVKDICPPGSGGGQCDNPTGVAVDEETGTLYVSDAGNDRVNVFAPDGTFLRAFGWGVADGASEALQVCTLSCFKGLRGGGTGQFALAGSGPDAIAVDNDPLSASHHDVFVFDGANRRVQRFSPTGEFKRAWGWDVVASGPNDDTTAPINQLEVCIAGEDVCKAGVSGTGAGQFDAATNPLDVGPEGAVYVGGQGTGNQSRVQEFDAEGSLVAVFPLNRDECEEGEAPNEVPLTSPFFNLAVDSEGNLFVKAGLGVRKYDPTGALLDPCEPRNPSANINAIALDPTDDLFIGVSDFGSQGGSEVAINLYDPAGTLFHTLYGNGTIESRAVSLAPFSNAGGDLFVVEGSNPRRVSQIAIEPPGPVVVPLLSPTAGTGASEVGNVRATLNARVNPEGKASTVFYEYVEEDAYEADIGGGGDGFGTAFVTEVSETTPPSIPPAGGEPFKAHDTSFAIACSEPSVELAEKIEAGECLEAETTYRFRAVAVNPDGEDTGPTAAFTTLPPIQPGPAWSTQVGASSARLHGQLNPTGIAASAHFQYVKEEAYLQDIEAGGDGFAEAAQTAQIDFGAGTEALSRSALVSSLEPGTTYRFRYLAENLFGEFPGPVRAFTTTPEGLASPPCPNEELRQGPSARLPECRAYELVSPADKGGADVRPSRELAFTALNNVWARIAQATPEGEAMSYASFQGIGELDSVHFTSQYVARRDADSGWSQRSVSHPREGLSLTTSPESASTVSPFWALSEDLCSEWLVQETDLALAPGAPPGVPNLYRRDNCGAGEGDYALLSSVVPPGFGKEIEVVGSGYQLDLGGFSADGRTAAFTAPAALVPEALVAPVGTVLKCDVAGATGAELEYRWHRDGEPITPKNNAEDPEYTTDAADAGKAIQCVVTATNEEADKGGGMSATVRASNPPVVIAPPGTTPPLPPPLVPAPISDAPLAVGGAGGQTLSCDPDEARWQGSPAFSYRWYRNGDEVGGEEPTYEVQAADLVSPAAFQCAVVGANAGGAAIAPGAVLLTEGGLEPAAPAPRLRVARHRRAYLHDGSGVHLISVLPDGTVALSDAAIGTALLSGASGRVYDSVAGAVSAEGSRVFFSVRSGSGINSRLYLRTNPAEPPSAIAGEECSEPGKACTVAIGSGAAIFRAADEDATRAIFSEGEDLYELDVGKAIAYQAGAASKIAGGLKGVMGWSEDLSRVYLVSSEDHDGGGPAQAGEFNLYLYEAGSGFTFVAELLSEGWEGLIPAEKESFAASDVRSISPFPVNRSARVSPDGLHAAFLSDSPALAEATAGYDNTDANSGEPDSEVYLFDAPEGSLRCVSCNPSGARPEGEDIIVGGGKEAWTAAKIPGWETQWHASRLLGPDGERLFFESLEALVPRDSNGRQDVYAWHRANSAAECAALGAERFSAANGGCLSLISSGSSPLDSEVLDASASGADVFFTTTSSLLPSDPGLWDIYDARVGGGFPPPPAPEPECEGEACQSPPAAPESPTPASSAFRGPGNLAADPLQRCRAAARKAGARGRRAASLSRRARRASDPRGKRRLRRAARVNSKRAGRLRAKARRCRARAGRRARR